VLLGISSFLLGMGFRLIVGSSHRQPQWMGDRSTTQKAVIY
jgi:hypothetical protein